MNTSKRPEKKITATFLPSMKRTEILTGGTIFEAAVSAGVHLEGSCGGKGLCGKCRVKLYCGGDAYPSQAEHNHLAEKELSAGMALACQRRLTSDATIEIQAPVIRKHGKGDAAHNYKPVSVDSPLKKRYLTIPAPCLSDQVSDLERVAREIPEIGELEADIGVLSELPMLLRQSDYRITSVLCGSRLMAVETGDTTDKKYGIAFDVGTTTVVGFLVDLNSGKVLAAGDATNYQQVFGADVISRINYTIENKKGETLLQKRVMEALEDIVSGLLKKSGISRDRVYESLFVGNTTMSHLLLGLDTVFIARSPFVPVFRQPLEIRNRDFGLNIHSKGIIRVLPNIAGFVGSDSVAVLLATRIDKQSGVTLIVDIGTNGEIMLAGGGKILACSTAAGPAFEGACIKCGMRAMEGAIEGVFIDEDIRLDVIGGGPASGICGSGLLDAVSELLRLNILDREGRISTRDPLEGLVNQKILNRIQEGEHGRAFILTDEPLIEKKRPVRITQKDIRELQLAKGAICAGIKVLLGQMEITAGEIDQVFLAGAFGNHIKTKSAQNIGLLPNIPPDRIHLIGNAAGEGARMALASKVEARRANELAQRVEHIELSGRNDFQEEFLNGVYFPVPES
jgi:uncharacterized 2Fe-2S/4Fe-4S cluster protein (DUF4445 family)